MARVKLGSHCSLPPKDWTVVSVARVHSEVSKQTCVINKSEVYSHSLGFVVPLHSGGRGLQDTTETSKVKTP